MRHSRLLVYRVDDEAPDHLTELAAFAQHKQVVQALPAHLARIYFSAKTGPGDRDPRSAGIPYRLTCSDGAMTTV